MIILIGFKACGKTTLGRLLAQQRCCSFYDSDRLIEERHFPLSCRQIHLTFGESYFRQQEAEVLRNLSFEGPCVLATGGGSLMREENGQVLKKRGILVYLRTSPQLLKERIWALPEKPSFLLTEDAEAKFETLYHARAPVYEKWADQIVEMDGFTCEEIVDLVKIFKPQKK